MFPKAKWRPLYAFCHKIMSIFVVGLDGPEEENTLNAVRLWRLAKQITSPGELLTLALEGLNEEDFNVEGHLYDNRDAIRIASFKVLQKWRNSQPNPRVAYTKMCEALLKVKLDHYIVSALK